MATAEDTDLTPHSTDTTDNTDNTELQSITGQTNSSIENRNEGVLVSGFNANGKNIQYIIVPSSLVMCRERSHCFIIAKYSHC